MVLLPLAVLVTKKIDGQTVDPVACVSTAIKRHVENKNKKYETTTHQSKPTPSAVTEN
jgi:hypothetical protein